jgi:serine/threonine protein phosphatase PrpC
MGETAKLPPTKEAEKKVTEAPRASVTPAKADAGAKGKKEEKVEKKKREPEISAEEDDEISRLTAELSGDVPPKEDGEGTEKGQEFWGSFKAAKADKAAADAADKKKTPAAAPAATKTTAADGEADGEQLTEAAAKAAAAEAAAASLPAALTDYSSSGTVAAGHVEIDSEDDEDELLADTVISGSSRYTVGFADTKGKRATMEDEMVVYGTFRENADEDYLAVFDGHGGSEASAMAAEELHEKLAHHLEDADEPTPAEALVRAFTATQKCIEVAQPAIQAGTTAVVAYIKGDKGYVANAGDSRAVLVAREAEVPSLGAAELATRLTVDHKPSLPSEEKRIKEAGGFVTRTMTKRGEISRVCAILGVARALGDTFLQPMVTCVPDVFEFDPTLSHSLILACDGLWDVVSDAEAAAIVRQASSPGEAAAFLRNFAFGRRSDDNISILVVQFSA